MDEDRMEAEEEAEQAEIPDFDMLVDDETMQEIMAEENEEGEDEQPSSQPNSQDIDDMINQAASASTKRSTKWGVNKFNQWVKKRNRQVDLATISIENLNSELRRFYADVKSVKGTALTPSALIDIRAALHRHLINPPLSRNINILNDREFTTANQAFNAKCKLYYKAGNKKPQHYPPIQKGDMRKLTEYFKNYDSDPTILLQYVWFSFCLYFGRRGREGWRDFKKDSFGIRKDDRDREYIYIKHTEQTKNHQGGSKQSDQDYSDQKVYATPGQLNLIEAYNLYLSKLNPSCEAFFQTPRKGNFDHSEHWFKNEPIGKNTLGNIMPRISKAANLSQIYTCHSVRASCITILGQNGIVPGNICKITKHKNEASLKRYFTELSNDQKQECTSLLSGALGEQPSTSTDIVPVPVPLPAPVPNPEPLPSTSNAGVLAEKMPDGSFSVTIPNLSQPQYGPVSCTSNSATTDMKYLQNLLPNCKFDSCTININTSGQN